MAGLDISLRSIEGEPGAAVAEMAGAIDGTTVVSFQDSLEEITKKGVSRLILDMSKVKYVNSTGLGSLVKYADRFKNSGGGMALIRVPAKVKIVIEMLGLHAFFDICKEEQEALDALKSADGGGTPETAQAEAPTSEPATKQQKTSPAKTATPQTTSAPAQTAPPKTEAPATKVDGLPATINCQGCDLLLEIERAGNFKCPRCFCLISVDGGGSVKFLSGERDETIELSLFPNDECATGLRRFVGALSESIFNGSPAAQSLDQAIAEVTEVLKTDVYPGKQEVYHVSIEPDRGAGKLQIKFSDHGTKVTSGRFSKSQALSEFECLPHPTGGNIIRLVAKG